MFRLNGRKALVTGASRGIGRAIALALANAGAYVIVHYGKSEKDAETLLNDIRKSGGTADIAGAGLASPEGASELAGKVRSLAGEQLDILVLNAGISKAARMEDHTVNDFVVLLATNLS